MSATTLEPKPVSIDIDAHRADMKCRAAEMEAMRPELERCCDPAYAAKREIEKPHYKWTIEAEWTGPDSDNNDSLTRFESKQTVVAQNEADAWSMFCDKIGKWPSPRRAKRTITKGKSVSASEVVTKAPEVKEDLPTKKIGAVPKAGPNFYSRY